MSSTVHWYLICTKCSIGRLNCLLLYCQLSHQSSVIRCFTFAKEQLFGEFCQPIRSPTRKKICHPSFSTPKSNAHSNDTNKKATMKISTAFPAAKLASVLAVLALCGIIGSNLSSVASVGRDEREGLFIPFFNFFRRSNLFTKRIDSGTNATFYISRNEWQLFEVFQEPETMCSCTATCLDPASRIDFYMTYDPRVRFNDPGMDGTASRRCLPTRRNARHHHPCRVTFAGWPFAVTRSIALIKRVKFRVSSTKQPSRFQNKCVY